MRRGGILWLLAGILLLGGCSYINSDQDEAAAGSDIMIERETQIETEEGPTMPWFPPEETTIAPLDLPELPTETPTVNPEIVIASDIHYLSKELTDFGDAFMEAASNRDGQMVFYGWEITEAFLDQVIKKRPQVLILAGDLTLNGAKASHETLAQLLKRVKDAGIPVAVIPGNHDINNPQAASYRADEVIPAEPTSPRQFANIYDEFGYGDALSRDGSSLSYVYQMTDGTWLVMLDSCQYEEAAQVGGMIGTDTYQWLEEQLEEAWVQGHQVLVVAHHNLMDESRIYEKDCTIEHAEQLEEILDRWGAGLFLSGHLHVQHYKTSEDYDIDEIVTSALSIFPCQYGVLQFFGPDHYFYRTEKTDVSMWSQQRNNPDRNLQDFEWYADEFLQDTFYKRAVRELQEKELTQDQIRDMAELYAILNVQAVAGNAYEVRDYVLTSPSYELWTQLNRTSLLAMYMEEVLEDGIIDYNKRSRP